MKTDSEVSEFWDEIEKEHNAKVVFKTFAILLGKSADTFQDLRGLLYIVGNMVVFEDFEKTDHFLGFLVRKKKEKKYEKFKISFPIDDILNIKKVSNQTARRCINGSLRHLETKTVSSHHRFFSRSLCQIQLRPDYSLFFDLLDLGGFIASCTSLGYTTA